MQRIVTLQRHIMETQRHIPGVSGEFSGLLTQITLAAKIISREVSKAGLLNILGFTDTGHQNTYGEAVRKLDVFANDIFIKALDHCGHVCVMASEENDDIITIPDKHEKGKYVVLFDPLDGSSNIDANVSIGSIFSIYRKITPGLDGTIEDCLQEGKKQVGAGYIIYGSSTMFVYCTGNGVHGFTLDPSVGEFLLSHENIQTPKRGAIYSVNEGNYNFWDVGIKKYIDYLKEMDSSTGRPYSSRYIGSMVADFHRNLLYGGIFLYPADYKKSRETASSKLRLRFEACPLAYIAEHAGGYASDGHTPILDIKPESLYQLSPIFIGSEEDVRDVERWIRENENSNRPN